MSGEVDIRDAFHQAHQRTYGHFLEDRTVEVVNLRLRALGVVDNPLLTAEDTEGDEEFEGATYAIPGDALVGEKEGVDGVHMALFEREMLSPGARFNGAALVFQLDSTIYIPEGWSARVDGYRNLILERGD
jgi:N-methylhydantoinase A